MSVVDSLQPPLFPGQDIAQAGVADAAPALVRQLTRLHRLDDPLPSHSLLLANLLDAEPDTRLRLRVGLRDGMDGLAHHLEL